jgi:hypothetical protein
LRTLTVAFFGGVVEREREGEKEFVQIVCVAFAHK